MSDESRRTGARLAEPGHARLSETPSASASGSAPRASPSPETLERASVGVWRFDPRDDTWSLDAIAAQLLLGAAAPHRLTGGAWRSALADGDRDAAQAAFAACGAGMQPRVDLHARPARSPSSGEWVWLLGAAESPGSPALSGIILDASAHMRSVRLRRAHEVVLQELADEAPLPNILTSLVRMIQDCSDGMLGSVLLLNPETQCLWTSAAPDLPADYSQAINGVRIGDGVGSCGTAAYWGARVVTHDIREDPRWKNFVEIADAFGLRACWSEPILDSTGAVLGTFALYYREPRGPTPADVELIETAARLARLAIQAARAHDALSASNRSLELAHARLNAILNGAPNVAIQCYDRQGRVLLWNPASERLYEYTAAEAIGRRLGEFLLPAAEASAFEGMLLSATPATKPSLREFNTTTRSGALRNVLASLFCVPDAGGGTHFVCVDIDVTERKRLEQQLVHSMKMEGIGRLAGGIAHDFNNLLTAILGYAQLAETSLQPGGETRTHLQQISRAAQRAAELTRNLLAFARRQIIEPRVVSLGALVREMERMLRRLIGEDIRIEHQAADDLWSVEVDPGQIEQIIVNMVVNSRDAMPGGGRIRILAENVPADHSDAVRGPNLPRGDYVVLSISDTGIGMSHETLAHIFEPFFTTKPPGAGTGLGLATAYGIVRQAGGDVVVESEPNRGTTFKIVLPRVRAAPAATETMPARRAAAAAGVETVLIVEDDALVRELAGSALRSLGYRVIEAATGDAALERAASYRDPIHLLLTDVVLPGVHGPRFVAQFLAQRPGVKVLYMTGYADLDVLREITCDARQPVLAKPFTPTELADRVRSVLDARPAGTDINSAVGFKPA